MDLAITSLYREADRQSPVPIVCKKGVRLWWGGDRVVTNDINNPTLCQLVVTNKIDIQKQNSQSQYRYCRRLMLSLC